MGVIHFPLICRWCRHDLKGQAFDGRCPQCAREIAGTLDPRLFDSATLAVNVDVSCGKCGYNLRTLTIDQVCPECAHPVVDSLRPNELRFADHGWMEKVSYGAIFLLIWLFGFWGHLLLLILTPVLFLWSIALPILFYLHGLTWSIGVFLFAAPEPSASGKLAPTWPNRLARLSAVGYQLLLPIIIYLYLSPSIFLYNHESVGVLVMLGVYCVGSASLTMCMKRLAERAKCPELAKLAVKQLVISMIIWGWVTFSCICSWAGVGVMFMWILILISYIVAIGLLLTLHHMVGDAMKSVPQEAK